MPSPNPSYAELVERVEKMESMFRKGGLPIDALPMKALQERMEATFSPEGDQFILPHSVGIDSLAAIPHARVRTDTTSAYLTAGAYTPIRFDTVVYNNECQINLTTNNTRITAKRGGMYFCSGAVTQENIVANQQNAILITKNGDLADNNVTQANSFSPAGGSPEINHIVRMVDLRPGDYIELQLFQVTVNGQPWCVDTIRPFLDMHYISHIEGIE